MYRVDILSKSGLTDHSKPEYLTTIQLLRFSFKGLYLIYCDSDT